MRKLFYTAAALSVLLATLMAANAAEVPPYARPVAPPVYLPPPFTWTGFYIGPNLGGAWSQRNLTDTLLGLSLSNLNDKGAFIGGGQLTTSNPNVQMVKVGANYLFKYAVGGY
jgi:outer membrane immunogenic protein